MRGLGGLVTVLSLCAAALAATAASPQAGSATAATWEAQTHIAGERFRPNLPLLGISCTSASFCVAVGELDTVVSSTNPTGGASAWTVTQLDPILDLRGVSCGTPTLCVAVAEQGRLLVSTNPTGGASAWKELGTPGGPGDLQGVSCAAAALCVAGNAGGNLLSSASPGVASAWQEADAGVSVQVTGVSCLPSEQCLAVDDNGDVITSTDPTGGSGAWSRVKLIPFVQPPDEGEEPLNGLFGVSCSSSSFCAVAGADGQVFTSTNPFAAASGPARHSGKGKKPKRPKTTIADLVLPNARELEHRGRGRVMVRFFANGPVRRFECRVKGRDFHRCHSPERFQVGKKGTFAVRVRAVGITGLRGPVAIKRFWTGRRCAHHSCFEPDGEFPVGHRMA